MIPSLFIAATEAASAGDEIGLVAGFSLIVVCLIGSGFFSGMETGITSIHRLRLKHLVHHDVPGAATLQEFVDDPDQFLGTTLVGTNTCNIICSVLGTSLAVQLIGADGYTVAGVGMTITLLVFGEYLPKAWFQARPSVRSRPFARLLKYFGYVFYPVSRVVIWLASILIPGPKAQGDQLSGLVTKEELRFLTSEGEKAGEFSPDERQMIHDVFELTHKTCRDIMIPKSDFVAIPSDGTIEDVLQLSRSRGLSRFPVYSKDSGKFVGIVRAFDILTDPTPEGKEMRDYVRPPQFAAADTPAHKLLPRMRLTQQPIALVIDTNSEVIGLITIEDLLDEIEGLNDSVESLRNKP